jgi:RNA polymerase sigma factor (sigma-70 family)
MNEKRSLNLFKPEDEAEFLNAIKQVNGPAGWKHFFKKYHPLLMRYATRKGMNRVESEDIASEVMTTLFIRVLEKRFQLTGPFRCYLAIIVRNEVIDYYRNTERFYGNGLAALSNLAKNVIWENQDQYTDLGEVVDLEVRQKLEILAEGMEKVKKRVAERSWEMFYEVTVENVPSMEVAQKFNVNPQTVYQRNFQILKMIRKACDLSQTKL